MKIQFPKNSIINDVLKRKAMLKWIGKGKPEDGRVGAILCLAWDAGYEAARKRFTPKTRTE